MFAVPRSTPNRNFGKQWGHLNAKREHPARGLTYMMSALAMSVGFLTFAGPLRGYYTYTNDI